VPSCLLLEPPINHQSSKTTKTTKNKNKNNNNDGMEQ
jgi:hypothetical protein